MPPILINTIDDPRYSTYIKVICILWPMTSLLCSQFDLTENEVFRYAVTSLYHPLKQSLLATLLLMQKRVRILENYEQLTKVQEKLAKAEETEAKLAAQNVKDITLPANYGETKATTTESIQVGQSLLNTMNKLEELQEDLNKQYIESTETLSRALYPILKNKGLSITKSQLNKKVVQFAEKIMELYSQGVY